jgi:hypothetical protein
MTTSLMLRLRKARENGILIDFAWAQAGWANPTAKKG